MGCKYMWLIVRNIHLLCFIHYDLGYFGDVGNRIVVYSSIVIYSPDLLVFACWWSFKLPSLCILCNKWNFSDTPPGKLPGVPSLFRSSNGFTVKYRWSVRMLCQCVTICAGYFTFDAHASRPVACLPFGGELCRVYSVRLLGKCRIRPVTRLTKT